MADMDDWMKIIRRNDNKNDYEIKLDNETIK